MAGEYIRGTYLLNNRCKMHLTCRRANKHNLSNMKFKLDLQDACNEMISPCIMTRIF